MFFNRRILLRTFNTVLRKISSLEDSILDLISSLRRSFLNFLLGQKKIYLFPEIGRLKTFLSVNCSHSWMSIGRYNFNLKKQKQEDKKKKKQKKVIKKREYLRKTYPDTMISFANLLYVLSSMMSQFTWSSREFLLIAHVNLMQFKCNERNHSNCYTTIIYHF